MISQIAITKIGRNSDGDCSFGFAYNEDGVSTYIPSTIIKLMGWTEADEGKHFTVALGPNGNDNYGATPFIVNSMAPKADYFKLYDGQANKTPKGSVHSSFNKPESKSDWIGPQEYEDDYTSCTVNPYKPEPKSEYTVDYIDGEEALDAESKKLVQLENEVIYHKLRGICPWGSGTNEGVRRAVSPYGDSGEYCSVVDVQDELVGMGLSEASATPAISLLTKAGFITRNGTTVTVTDAGVDAIDLALATFDDSPREVLRQEEIQSE